MASRHLEAAKGLYRRIDALLAGLGGARAPEFLPDALVALFTGFARELDLVGAELAVLGEEGPQAVATAGADSFTPAVRRALALRAHGQVALDESGRHPLGAFVVVHDGRACLFLFAFAPSFDRDAAELFLNTASSILSVHLGEHRLGATLREAAEIQAGLLPEHPPEFPGFELAAISRPADEVGGDWYDFLPLGEGLLGVAVGDASGHGLPAALMARDVVVGLRMGIEREFKAEHALAKLNRVLHRSTLSSRFTSLVYGELEENGSFFYYNAGHDAPLLVHAGRCESLRTGGTVLGPLSEARFRRNFAHLDHGALLDLHTDGLIERRALSGELFGLERLKCLLVELAGEPLEALVRRVLAELDEFGAGVRERDDETLVVVRRR
ncbi:MAG: PP2C family protein-serine/threonine phosphatase [Planctomycetota bacterium]